MKEKWEILKLLFHLSTFTIFLFFLFVRQRETGEEKGRELPKRPYFFHLCALLFVENCLLNVFRGRREEKNWRGRKRFGEFLVAVVIRL